MSASSFAGRAAAAIGGPTVLGSLLCATTVALVWLGVRATLEWERSDRQVATRRASETLALVSSALNRDMKGVHASVLAAVRLADLSTAAPYDLADRFGTAFARFPYPESFFVWTARHLPEEGATTFFNRASRPPPWWSESIESGYPVAISRSPTAARLVVAPLLEMATPLRPVVAWHTSIEGTSYQVVAQALYAGPTGDELAGMVGYTVNLGWVREHYFRELLPQVLPVAAADAMAVAVLDGAQQRITSIGDAADGVVRERLFPPSFFEVSQATVVPTTWDAEDWHLRVTARLERASGPGRTSGTLLLIAAAAGGLLVALLATVRAARTSAQVADLKSEFVSTVTHELKTPVAGIKLVAESLAAGRYASTETVREYGALLSQETHRLSQLLENLLAYARLSDVHQAYVFESLDPGELVDEALDRCATLIDGRGFRVVHGLPPDLPRIRGDRSAVVQVLENLIDNALHHGSAGRLLEVHGQRRGDAVELVVRDHGPGIGADELPHVTDKFFRGRHARTRGSGLGLTIAQRIVGDHGGGLAIDSTPGQGTAVRLTFPLAAS